MAKAKLLKVEEVTSGIPSGMQAKDLSLEKRMELYQADFKKFNEEMAETYGLSLATEIKYAPQAIVPRMVLVDLLKKQDGQNENPNS